MQNRREKSDGADRREAREPIGLLALLKGPMTDQHTPFPFAHLGLERAIALRWTLRDIKAKRLKLSPASPVDLAALTELGLIELRDDVPVLTQAGHDALD
jgi:hypothetical protein